MSHTIIHYDNVYTNTNSVYTKIITCINGNEIKYSRLQNYTTMENITN